MPGPYAREFSEITAILAANAELRAAVDALAATEPMPGKVTEGGDRLLRFRPVLRDLIAGRISLDQAYQRTGQQLPRSGSPHARDNRVFAGGWEERLVRTQLSRCYNQAAIEALLAEGHAQGFVPHSSAEKPDSQCSRQLAGANHDLVILRDRLIQSYREGNWSKEPKIPEHPHCTHVITPPR